MFTSLYVRLYTVLSMFLLCLNVNLSFSISSLHAQPRHSSPSPTPKRIINPQRPQLRICTGNAQNHYYHVGKMIAKALSSQIDVQLVETRGSLENLHQIHQPQPKCDAIIAQDDAYALFLFDHPQQHGRITRLAQLYPEHIHFLCNRNLVAQDDLDQIKTKREIKVLIGSEGSGTYITWNLMKRLNPNYRLFKERPLSGLDALSQITKGVQAQCMLTVTALAQGFIAKANDRFGEHLKLLSINNSILQTPINQGKQSRRLYHPVDVHQNVYPLLLDKHLKTQTVDAVLFVHAQWLAAFPQQHQILTETLNQLKDLIMSSIR